MSQNCSGHGTCIRQCSLSGNHQGCDPGGCYINNDCMHGCELHKCNNFIICGTAHPLWYLDCHNKCCMNCNMIYGQITFTDTIDHCSICRENKKMIRLACDQECCFECYTLYCENSNNSNCPLCGKLVWARQN